MASIENLPVQLRWLNDPHVWFRHPILRLFLAFFILFLDMLLFWEDPVNDSHVEANLPGMGHIYALFVIWPSSVSLKFLRLILLPIAFFCGAFLGRQVVHHRFLRNFCKLEMFEGNNGTLLPMGFCLAGTLFICCMICNLATSDASLQMDGSMGFQMRTFAKLSQCCSVTADLVAIMMIADAVLQDDDRYPDFLRVAKEVWRKGCNGYFRVVAVWITFVVLWASAMAVIASTGKDVAKDYTDRRNADLSETVRAIVASSMIFCDLFTVAQDWDFPSFKQAMDLKAPILIAGTFVPELKCDLMPSVLRSLPSPPNWCRKWLPEADWFTFTVTGPWLSYGPLLVVIGIDLFCMKTQIMYTPSLYGQYVNNVGHPPDYRIWTIVDETYLSQAYTKGILTRTELITYAARWNITNGNPVSDSAKTDVLLKARYEESSLKYVAAVPGLLTILVFLFLVWGGNKRRFLLELMEDPSKIIDLASDSAAAASHMAADSAAAASHMPAAPVRQTIEAAASVVPSVPAFPDVGFGNKSVGKDDRVK